MAISEAARAELYTGLAEVLGPRRAEILMAALPTFDPTHIATKDDIRELRELLELRFDEVDRRFEQVDQRFERVDRRLEGFDTAFHRLYLTLVTGLFVIVAAMVGIVLASL